MRTPHLALVVQDRIAAAAARVLWLCALSAAAAWPLAAQERATLPEPVLPTEFEVDEIDPELLQFEFNEPMQIWQNREETDRLQLSPGLPTVCAWDSDTQLSCWFTRGKTLQPATRYLATLREGLVTRSGRRLGALRFTVDGPRPEVSAWLAGWSGNRPEIEVTTSADADPASLPGVLRLTIGGRDTPVQLVPIPPGAGADERDDRRYRLVLPALPASATGEALELHARPGLRSLRGPLAGEDSSRLLHVLDREPFRLREASCNGPQHVRWIADAVLAAPTAALGPCVPAEPLRLSFSRMPSPENQAAVAGHLPAGLRLHAWEEERAWQRRTRRPSDAPQEQAGAVAVIEIVDADADFTLALDGMADADGHPLVPAQLSLRSGPQRPRLEATGARQLLADPAALSRHARTVNAPAAVLDLTAMAGALRQGTLSLADSRGGRLPVHSTQSEAVLRDGGWVRWSGGKPVFEQGGTVEWAAPRFDLLAVRSEEELVAWARRWEDGGPVAGAEVELLQLTKDGKDGEPAYDTVARARTDADGIVRLPLPDRVPARPDGRNNLPQWMIRAVGSDAARAVLPMQQAYSDAGSPLKVWGVSDRPLYRAGDTLHYRLWWREAHGGRLRQPKQALGERTLTLVESRQDRPLLTWTLSPDADGSAEGRIVLPRHLTDGDYCIEDEQAYDGGLCVYIGSFRAQDLWARAEASAPSPARPLRAGEAAVVEVSAGYYSGGVAAGVRVDEVDARVQAGSPGDAFPAFAEYRFLGGALSTGIRFASGLRTTCPPCSTVQAVRGCASRWRPPARAGCRPNRSPPSGACR